MNNLKNIGKKQKGITLIALIVTVIILLILAGITLIFVFGNNGILSKAQNAKDLTDKSSALEKIKLVIADYIIEKNANNASEDYFWNKLISQGIVDDREYDVLGPEVDDDGNKRYEVETTDDYTIEIIIDPNGNITIGEITKSTEAKIRKITISTTENSFHVEVETKNMEKDDKLIISYKAEGESSYTQINEENNNTADKTGLTVGSKGEIKVQIVGKDGTVKSEKTRDVQAGIAVTSIELNKTNENLKVGEELQLTAEVSPNDATNKNVEWTSNNANVATVDNTGKVTTKKSGEVTITATAKDGSGTKAECHIKVTQPVTGVSVTPVTGTVKIDKTLQLTATVQPSDATNKEITWSITSGSLYAKVNEKGLVTGLAEGTAVVTVTTKDGSKTASSTITVQKPTVADLSGTKVNKETTTEDKYGNKIVIPANFKVVPNGGTDNATKVTYSYNGDGTPAVQDGIVVQDGSGNQFVWIPVGTIKNKSGDKNGASTNIKLGRYEFNTSNGTPTLRQEAETKDSTKANYYTKAVTIDSNCQELTTNNGNTSARNLKDFIDRTIARGGYYLARYEASQNGTIPLSQGNKTVWSNITQQNAATYSKNYTSTGVVSDLVNSYAWDTAIVFIEKYSSNSNYANKIDGKYVARATGVKGDVVCNVHDMAANFFEWSTEHSTYTTWVDPKVRPTVWRGGGWYNAESTYSASRSSVHFPNNTEHTSFRIILY